MMSLIRLNIHIIALLVAPLVPLWWRYGELFWQRGGVIVAYVVAQIPNRAIWI